MKGVGFVIQEVNVATKTKKVSKYMTIRQQDLDCLMQVVDWKLLKPKDSKYLEICKEVYNSARSGALETRCLRPNSCSDKVRSLQRWS